MLSRLFGTSLKSSSVQKRTEAHLLLALREGHDLAIKSWFEQYHGRLLAFIAKKVSNKADAEEITQQTFINCLKHLPLFRGHSSLWTWMCSIAQHEVADYYRRKYAKKTIQTMPMGEQILELVAPGARKDTAHELSVETIDAVKQVLVRMRPKYRELLQLKYVDKKTVQEIAELFDQTVKAIESDLFRARQEFKVLWATTQEI